MQSISLLNIVGLLGGAALLLFGLDIMSENLSRSAGKTLRLILEKATGNTYLGLVVGTVITGIVNSSSAVTSILVSLVQSKLMSFERSIAVILGANIGSTVTGQIMAFDITKWSMAIIFVGFIIRAVALRSKTRYLSMIIIGLGILFLGLEYMSSSMKGFRDSPFFINLMVDCENVWFGILIGAVFTAIIHSSGAFTGITVGLAMQGLITLEAAVPLILGSNVGTCVTAWVASLGSGSSAKRVAMAHILYNVIGVLLFVFWVPQFVWLIKVLTPDQTDIPRLIANAQTYFNVFSALIFLPFLKNLEWLTKVCVPEDKEKEGIKNSIDAITKFKNVVKEMLWLSRDYFIKKDQDKINEISRLRSYQQEFRLDLLEYLNNIGKSKIPYKDVAKVINQVSLVNEIDRIAFELETALETLDYKTPNFDDSYSGMEEYFKKTIKCFSKACNAVLHDSSFDSKNIQGQLALLRSLEEELLDRSIQKIHNDQNYEIEKLNLWVLEFIRSINLSSQRITGIVETKGQILL